MTTANSDAPSRPTIHPLMAVAAVSVVLLSATGIAAMTGLLGAPSASTQTLDTVVAVVEPPAVAIPATATPAAPTPLVAAPVTATPLQAQPVGPAPASPRAVAPRTQPVAQAAPIRTPSPAHAAQAPVAAPVETPPPAQPAAAAPAVDMRTWATVESLNEVRKTGEAGGIGAVAGALAGGVLGNQASRKSSNRNAIAVVGAVGGGLLGHQVERQVRAETRYDVNVRMHDGTIRTFSRDTPWSLQSGDRVRVIDGQLVTDGVQRSSAPTRPAGVSTTGSPDPSVVPGA